MLQALHPRKLTNAHEVSGSYSREAEDLVHLGCDAKSLA
jgi:hypothetical protein